MDQDGIFVFDLQGYIVIRGVLSPDEVAAANRSIDAHVDELEGFESTQDMLGWSMEERRPFQQLLAHPRIVPYLNEICGRGFRMDHCPTLLSMTRGSAAGGLHGASGPGFDPMQYYVWKDNQMHNGLVVVTFQLVDHPVGAGGLCFVPGTHKSNVRGPAGLYNFESHGHLVKQEETKAGDVVIFTEAVTHGTLPWTMPYDRRSVLYRYSPANSAYAGGRHDMDSDHRAGPAWPLSWYDGLTDAQRAVLEPPYHPRHQRPILGDDGELLEISKRQLAERGWDGIGDNWKLTGRKKNQQQSTSIAVGASKL